MHAVPRAVVHAGAVSDPHTQILQTFIAIQDATLVDGGSAKLGYSLRTPCRALSKIQELDLWLHSCIFNVFQDATLVDGGGAKPGYSLRTLCRALSYTRAALVAYGLQRALYDGAAMAFLTQLAPGSAPRLEALLRTHLLPGVTNLKVQLRLGTHAHTTRHRTLCLLCCCKRASSSPAGAIKCRAPSLPSFRDCSHSDPWALMHRAFGGRRRSRQAPATCCSSTSGCRPGRCRCQRRDHSQTVRLGCLHQ